MWKKSADPLAPSRVVAEPRLIRTRAAEAEGVAPPRATVETTPPIRSANVPHALRGEEACNVEVDKPQPHLAGVPPRLCQGKKARCSSSPGLRRPHSSPHTLMRSGACRRSTRPPSHDSERDNLSNMTSLTVIKPSTAP
jgi:hypothetical protein